MSRNWEGFVGRGCILLAVGCVACSPSVSGSTADAGAASDGGMSDAATDAMPIADASPPRCLAGDYSGTFDGTVTAAGTTGPVSGSVSLTLGEAVEDDVHSIGNGTMSGTALGLFPFEGQVTGILDCTTARFTGMMVDASVNVMGMLYQFEGTMTADYVVFEYRFTNGVWEGEQTGGGPPSDGVGNGTWQAGLGNP